MKRLTSSMVCLAMVLLLAACGDDGGGGGGATNNGEPTNNELADAQEVEDFLFERSMAYQRDYCENYHSDCPNSARNEFLSSGNSLEECIENQRQRLLDNNEMDPATLESGRRGFDAAKARQCMDALAAERDEGVCSELSLAVKELCRSVITGSRASGEPCLKNWDCQSNSCIATEDDAICYGECSPLPTIVGEGEACVIGGDLQCDRAQNLRCDLVDQATNEFTCIVAGSRVEGEACAVDDSCEDGLLCKGRTCVGSEPAGVGESCLARSTAPVDENSAYCASDLYCRVLDDQQQGTCAEYGVDGDPCDYNTRCGYPFRCDRDAGVCTEPGGVGDPCDGYGDCGIDSYCDEEAGVCAAAKGEGEACENLECEIGLYCKGPDSDNLTCRPSVGGESCELPSDDASQEGEETP